MQSIGIPCFFALFLIVSGGAIHGITTQRWSFGLESRDPRIALESDQALGDWQPEEFQTVQPADLPEKTQMVSRVYRNHRDHLGTVVSVISGHPGVVAAHTPDICYLGSGYKLRTAVKKETFDLADGQGKAEFYVTEFSKATSSGLEVIRVRWTWTSDGQWQAPDYPRWAFGGRQQLHKVYIVEPITDQDNLTGQASYRSFVVSLMPELRKKLIPAR